MSAEEREIERASGDDDGSFCIRCGDEVYEGDLVQWRRVNPSATKGLESRMVGIMHNDCAAAEDNPRRQESQS